MTPSPLPAPHPAASGAPAARPLLVTADEAVLDDVLRLAAAAGVSLDVARDLPSARPLWTAAPLVVLGDDVVHQVALAAVPRRPGVVLVGLDADDGGTWQRAVGVGAEHVAFLPDGEPWLVSRLADAAESREGGGAVLAVVGGRGGAGASVTAAALALAAAAQGVRCLLLDADPWAGGIDLVLGAEDCQGLRWPDLAETRGRVSGAALRAALPSVAALAVLSWDRGDLREVPTEAVSTVLAAARRSGDLVVVDLPRRLDAATREVLAASALTVVVTTADVRAAAATSRVATALTPLCSRIGLLVRGPARAGVDAEVIAGATGLPLLAQMRPDGRLDALLADGRPLEVPGRGPLASAAQQLLGEVLPRPTRRRSLRRRAEDAA